MGSTKLLNAIFLIGTTPVVALAENGECVLRNTHRGFVLPQTSQKTGGDLARSGKQRAGWINCKARPFGSRALPNAPLGVETSVKALISL